MAQSKPLPLAIGVEEAEAGRTRRHPLQGLVAADILALETLPPAVPR